MRDLLDSWRALDPDAREHVLSALRSGIDYAESSVRLAGGRDLYRLQERAKAHRVARAILAGAQYPSSSSSSPRDTTTNAPSHNPASSSTGSAADAPRNAWPHAEHLRAPRGISAAHDGQSVTSGCTLSTLIDALSGDEARS